LNLNAAFASANAAASVVSLALAISAFRAIRRKEIALHRARMIGAVAASFVFLVLFVIRFATFGFKPLHAEGGLRVFYLILLYSHEPLAVVNIPLVLGALALGLKKSFRAHREISPMAFWIWCYVLASGIALYGLLYLVA
jgi:putative membrane protein